MYTLYYLYISVTGRLCVCLYHSLSSSLLPLPSVVCLSLSSLFYPLFCITYSLFSFSQKIACLLNAVLKAKIKSTFYKLNVHAGKSHSFCFSSSLTSLCLSPSSLHLPLFPPLFHYSPCSCLPLIINFSPPSISSIICSSYTF